MTIQLNKSVKNIFVLGAGASVDYGLPVWKDLSNLLVEKVSEDAKDNYKHKKEILEWLEKVGENKAYETIDKCIRDESLLRQYPESPDIENEIFSAIKNIFGKLYKKNDNGWINILNEKILINRGLESSLAFINFNYDDILEKNFLNFSYLHPKQRLYNYRPRLATLSNIGVTALYPHGKFFENQDEESHIFIKKETMKSHQKVHLDVVSCYESNKHTIVYNDLSDAPFELYLMGLGGGLRINLNNIVFPRNPISTVHVTIKDPAKKDEVIGFLTNKYKTAEIKIYYKCDDLVKKVF